VGKKPGIYHTWAACQSQTNGFSGATFKKFSNQADAMQFLTGSRDESTTKSGVVKPSKHLVKAEVSERIHTAHDTNSTSTVRTTTTNTTNTTTTREVNEEQKIIVWTDGACKNNGKSDLAIAGIGVYFGPNDPRNLSERLPGSKQTNQRAEITAAIRCLEQVQKSQKSHFKLEVRTDSKYVVDGMTTWIKNWKRNKWNNEVVNKDLWQRIDQLATGISVTWVHVLAHSGIAENEAADELAVAGCYLPKVDS